MNPTFGVAWFKKEDWSRLLEISEDRENLRRRDALKKLNNLKLVI